MGKAVQIFPECDGDTALIEVLGFKNPNHQLSISRVLHALSTSKSKALLIGVIDNDKRKPTGFQEFTITQNEQDYAICKHKDRDHYLFVINPALEKFLFKAAEQTNVDPAKFGFSDIERLKKVCKNRGVRTNNNFKQFVNTIQQKKEDSCVKALKKWLFEILGHDD
ncbi:MAG: hypothetical protein H6577_21735 [Lewinellaceae bacterium]|nr:hypothetical protein [Saprospiraceae bacterium]MCB9340755.1 hypothetical protein [Lewinellaceae bacterium]